MQGELFCFEDEKYKPQKRYNKKSETYEEFVEKFKPKKTTDDCYTPPDVYEVIKDFALEQWRKEQKEKPLIMCPFYPGGDFENECYPDNAFVVDNPPFSIFTRILDFYLERNIRFFLFYDTRTLFSTLHKNRRLSFVISSTSIYYENGARVTTAFVTNIFNPCRLILSYNLKKEIAACESQHGKKKIKRAYRSPDFYSPLDFARLVNNFELEKEFIIEGAEINSVPYSAQIKVEDDELRKMAGKLWKD